MRSMMNIVTFAVLSVLLTGSTTPGRYAQAAARRLTLTQAIQRAERFIRDNGYTDFTPVKDRSKLSYESLEWGPTQEEILEQRHNTLERKAYGYLHQSKLDSGWTVAFRYKSGYSQINGTGRAVTMESDGSNMRVEHMDIFLKACRKLKRNGKTSPLRENKGKKRRGL